jgi:hypothetical protein
MRGEPIERINEHVAAAGIAAAEARELGAELGVFALDDFQRDVRYPTTASAPCAAIGEAVKVDPVVPVKRTVR